MKNIDIERLASLARLRIPDEEREHYRANLEEILAYVDELARADTADIESARHILGLTNALRSDEGRILRDERLAEKLVGMAFESKDSFISVPRVLYHEEELGIRKMEAGRCGRILRLFP